jgi:hypothetical protein
MQLGDKPIKVFPAKLPPTLIAHGGKGGDMGAMQKAMDVQVEICACAHARDVCRVSCVRACVCTYILHT